MPFESPATETALEALAQIVIDCARDVHVRIRAAMDAEEAVNLSAVPAGEMSYISEWKVRTRRAYDPCRSAFDEIAPHK